MIKAIETRYKGYRFRSRLEARWAVFFDAVGEPWEYEPEGYELPARKFTSAHEQWLRQHHGRDVQGTDLDMVVAVMKETTERAYRYLPDFWLPRRQWWAEVKGDLNIVDADKMVRLVNGSGYPLLLLRDLNKLPVVMKPDDGENMTVTFAELTGTADFEYGLAAARAARFEHGETPR